MPIPPEILAVPRPKNSIVTVYGKNKDLYAVRMRIGCRRVGTRNLPINGPTIGHIINNQYVPKVESKKTQPKSTRFEGKFASAYALSCLEIAKEAKLYRCLNKAYGKSTTLKLLAIASFVAAGKSTENLSLDDFLKEHFAFIEEHLNRQTDFSDEAEDNFYKLWIANNLNDSYNILDAGSLLSTNAHKSIPDNLGIICNQKTGLAVFCTSFVGELTSGRNLRILLDKAQTLNLKGECTLVMTGSQISRQSLQNIRDNGCTYLSDIPTEFLNEVRDQILKWRQLGDDSEIYLKGEDIMREHEIEMPLGATHCKLLLYKSALKSLDEERILVQRFKLLEEEISKKHSLTKSEERLYQEFFKIDLKDDGTFSFSLNQEALNQALLLCGSFALLSNHEAFKAKIALESYTLHQNLNQALKALNNTAAEIPLIVFLALILRRAFEERLQDDCEHKLASLIKLHCQNRLGQWESVKTLDKTTQSLLYALKLPLWQRT